MEKSIHDGVYWTLSLFMSMIAVALIGYKWHIDQPGYKEGIQIVSGKEDLEKVFSRSHTKEFKGGDKPVYIPIGFFIQSFSFLNSNDVNFNGYVWMKSPKNLPEGFVEGFIFPEEVASSATKTEKIYTVDQGDHKLTGWYFDVIVRQSFDYSDYPLDHHSVWLRIWPKEFIQEEKVVLVPDFASYAPESLADGRFGMDVDIIPSGWRIIETFFSYKRIPYDTSFGFHDQDNRQGYIELYYNIGINRNFVDAFIINLTPLFFVTLLLFGMVMTVSDEKKRKENLGFNTTNTIAICASLLFVVLLLHIQIRSHFPGSRLMYIEYFYLIVYLVIFLTALNSYIFSMGWRNRFNIFHYKDNFIPKVFYWPGVLWMMAAATWLKL